MKRDGHTSCQGSQRIDVSTTNEKASSLRALTVGENDGETSLRLGGSSLNLSRIAFIHEAEP